MADFAAQVLRAVEGRPPKRLVIDVRWNGGGATSFIDPMLEALKRRPDARRRGNLFVLIGRETFSAGYILAWAFRDKLRAILAGEPTGQKPNSYGDARQFILPNSGLRVSYPTKKFQLVPGDPEAIFPDIAVTTTAGEHFAGRDSVLDRVLGPP